MNLTTDDNFTVDKELYPALIQCFFIIGAGYIAGQLKLLTNAHSIGLSRYVSNFALPAIIFQNLVVVNFKSVSWQFLASVFLTKTFIFFLTAILTLIVVRPRNFASIGQYAIITTQTNDFALMLPIIEAVYKQTHPEYSRYVYLIAPISLVILNPIGFFLIELQKHFDEQKKHRDKSLHILSLISKVARSICRNPFVICTILGVLFNRIFHQQLPSLIDYILTPIAHSFTATALFYLGLTMVGRLNRFQTNLVLTVCLLSLIKLILFPLVLRQAVFFLVKPINDTIEYSNLGFLYGTAPTAPSVVFYVPETNLALQAISSTVLVVSTLLSGPIILISAKMIHLKIIRDSYEFLLSRTAFDVSILSLFCTIIVLIGFCVRHRGLKTSFVHKYTLILVGLQMILSIWMIAMHYLNFSKDLFDIGSIFLAFTTRTWSTSLAIALMLTICHSNQLAQRYSWIYHVYGWLMPIFTTFIIYLFSSNYGTQKSDHVHLFLSIILLGICISLSTISLVRIARRTYRIKHKQIGENEGRKPLINDHDEEEDGEEKEHGEIQMNPQETENDSQLFRHGILVTFLTIDAVICISVLFWLVISHNRNGIYYELKFLDTVLLYGQGFITFLIFALDVDLLVPITGKFLKCFRCLSKTNRNRSIETRSSLDFEFQIRSDFLRHSSTIDRFESTFNGHEFCQWLIETNHVDNEQLAKEFLKQLIDQSQVICLNQNSLDDEQIDSTSNWYAFSK